MSNLPNYYVGLLSGQQSSPLIRLTPHTGDPRGLPCGRCQRSMSRSLPASFIVPLKCDVSPQIRNGYRKASLQTHPDRNPDASPEERRRLTAEFQKVADAYYVLSDAGRRREYDAQRKARPDAFDSTTEGSSADYFTNFFFNQGRPGHAAGQDEGFESEASSEARPNPDQTFGDAFEEVR